MSAPGSPAAIRPAAHPVDRNGAPLSKAQALDAQALNQACRCHTLDAERLRRQLEADPSLAGLGQHIAQTRPHLFSSTAVFLPAAAIGQITQAVAALERVMALAPYRAAALARAPAIAAFNPGPAGVFMSYDFHMGQPGAVQQGQPGRAGEPGHAPEPAGLLVPRLIEVNTNAGGALLNAALARAQVACCEPWNPAFQPPAMPPAQERFFQMFQAEWRAQRGAAPLRSVAIVDDEPAAQYLAPEFELARLLFEQRGLDARIVDAAALSWRAGRLHHGDWAVDLVYNRLTDFYLEEPRHAALRAAYEAGAVVLTPHPWAHAVHADKRNLIALSDSVQLAAWGVDENDRRLLAAVVPRTVAVTPACADDLWARRRDFFFKPVAGHGAKGAYRGDKLTHRVWAEIMAGGYVAQALVPPAERAVAVDGQPSDLKFDLRAYTYAGQVLLIAARMYRGQTTNFRTPGGGFAPVIAWPPVAGAPGPAESPRLL